MANAEKNTSGSSFPPGNRVHFKQGLLINHYFPAQRKGSAAGKLQGRQEKKGHLWRGRSVTSEIYYLTAVSCVLVIASLESLGPFGHME